MKLSYKKKKKTKKLLIEWDALEDDPGMRQLYIVIDENTDRIKLSIPKIKKYTFV